MTLGRIRSGVAQQRGAAAGGSTVVEEKHVACVGCTVAGVEGANESRMNVPIRLEMEDESGWHSVLWLLGVGEDCWISEVV